MNAAGTPFESQARLWLLAFVASVLVNALVLGGIGFWVLASIALRPPPIRTEPSERVAMIVPQLVDESAAAMLAAETTASAEDAAKPFVRTSPEQVASAPEKPDFMGERNTRATSEVAPKADAPEMPNQKGREPFSEGEIETTESNYQDGKLEDPGGPPMPAAPAEEAIVAEPPPAPAATESPAPDPSPAPPAKERLAEGPLPVDRRVKMEETEEPPKPAPPERKSEGKEAVKEEQQALDRPKPAVATPPPGFRGNQTKTRLEGSIARVGRSALNVEDSALGRYHATVSRAVEKAWQLNCVRNRDYITPGQLTLRVMLEASGKVRSMGVVDEIGVGNIQKGFTLNSIRDAEIPSMPGALKKQLDGEPLELIYRFNF